MASIYGMAIEYCRTIALRGQYEPYYDESDSRQVDGESKPQIMGIAASPLDGQPENVPTQANPHPADYIRSIMRN